MTPACIAEAQTDELSE